MSLVNNNNIGDELTEEDECIEDDSSNSDVSDFGDLSTTLKEIDDTLNEQNADQLLNQINDSSQFLKELINKQQRSHQKIQKLQRSIQKRKIKSAMIIGSIGPTDLKNEPKISMQSFSLRSPSMTSSLRSPSMTSSLRSPSMTSIDDIPSVSDLCLHDMEETVITAEDSISNVGVKEEAIASQSSVMSIGSYMKIPSEHGNLKIKFDAASFITDDFLSASLPDSSSQRTSVVNIYNTTIDDVHSYLTEDITASTHTSSERQYNVNNKKIPSNKTSTGDSTLIKHAAIDCQNTNIIKSLNGDVSNQWLNEIGASNQETEKTDELFLYFDLMSAHMKEMKLEKERMKLDVLVALRTKLQNVYEGESLERIPAKFAEKLNENLYEVMLEEVTKVKEEEQAKYTKERQGYILRIERLSAEFETLTKEKCELQVELNSYKESTARLKDFLGESDQMESRVAYLEDVLSSVEKENEKLKITFKRCELENEELKRKTRDLEYTCEDSARKNENLQASEEMTRATLQNDIESLMTQNKKVNDELFTLESEKQYFRNEMERLKNSKETDLSIIKHLEEKLKKQETALENVDKESDKKFEENLKLESKTADYKQKLKKCLHEIERSRQENEKLSGVVRNLQKEVNDSHQPLHSSKLKESDLILSHAKERAELENTVNKMVEEERSLNEKISTLEKATEYYKRMLKSQSSTDLLKRITNENTQIDYNRNSPVHNANSVQPHLHSVDLSKHHISPAKSPAMNLSRNRTKPSLNSGSDSFPFDHQAVTNTHYLYPTMVHANFVRTPLQEQSNSWRNAPTSPVRPKQLTGTHDIGNASNLSNPRENDTDFLARSSLLKKYSENETRLFLKEMMYKLEHSENAMKLADQDEYMSPLPTDNNLEERVRVLQSEMMSL